MDEFEDVLNISSIRQMTIKYFLETGYIEDTLIRDFEKETKTYLDAEKQIKSKDKEKDWDIEM